MPSEPVLPDSVELKSGEALLVGKAGFSQAESFTVSFILSEDEQEIHNIKIEIENLHLEYIADNSITTIQVGRSEITYSGSHKVINGELNVTSTGFNLAVTINGKTAEGIISYSQSHRLSSTGIGLGEEVLIDMGTQPIILTDAGSASVITRSEKEEESAKSDYEGLPASIFISENEYIILDVKLSKGDVFDEYEGDYETVITAITKLPGFETALPDNPEDKYTSSEYFPIWCTFLSEDAQHPAYKMEFSSSQNIGEIEVIYTFASSRQPKKIVFFDEEQTSNQRVIICEP